MSAKLSSGPKLIRGDYETERGAVMIESALALLIFLLTVLFLFELCRFIYFSLSAQFSVTQGARVAASASTLPAPASNFVCCVQRVTDIKRAVVDRARGLGLGLDIDRDVAVCALGGDCNLCDQVGLPDPPNRNRPNQRPGFNRNTMLNIVIERELPFVIFPFRPTLNSRALTRIQSTVRDCPVP